MMNQTFAINQLTQALTCVQRVLAELRTEEAGAAAPQPEYIGTCTRPPAGWTCSRGLGHDGPCAASPPQITEDRHGKLHYDDSLDHAAARLPDDGQPATVAYASVDLVNRLEDRIITIDEGLSALRANVIRLERIVLRISVDACAAEDLFGF
jgi:hypothetical protein